MLLQTLCLLLFLSLNLGDDLYKLLEVSKDATNRDIRKSFKKLALKYHPDKNSEEDAHDKFLKINRAYEVPWILIMFLLSFTNILDTKR